MPAEITEVLRGILESIDPGGLMHSKQSSRLEPSRDQHDNAHPEVEHVGLVFPENAFHPRNLELVQREFFERGGAGNEVDADREKENADPLFCGHRSLGLTWEVG